MNATLPLEPRGWTARRWRTAIILVVLAHVALVFIFGTRQGAPGRLASRVPVLQLAPANNLVIQLNDPSLFALPHPNDFASAHWPALVTNPPPTFHWQEPPGWLPLSRQFVLKTFSQFMATNPDGDWTLNFQPNPEFSQPESPPIPPLPSASTLRLRGELARLAWLNPSPLPDWPTAGLIAPSKVQVVVDTAGRVLSAVLLPPDYGLDQAVRDDAADQRALQMARSARFSPAPQLLVGQMIFNWHAVPLPLAVTNAPSRAP
jgi:hypothetical protein